MKAIVTKYRPGTNTRGSRIIASDSDGNKVIFDHSCVNSHEAHANAAIALCAKMGWYGVLIQGELGNGKEVFVWQESWSISGDVVCKGTEVTVI